MPPETMASCYMEGHLILQVQCTEKEAAAVLKNLQALNDMNKRMKLLENQLLELDKSAEKAKQRTKELKQMVKEFSEQIPANSKKNNKDMPIYQ